VKYSCSSFKFYLLIAIASFQCATEHKDPPLEFSCQIPRGLSNRGSSSLLVTLPFSTQNLNPISRSGGYYRGARGAGRQRQPVTNLIDLVPPPELGLDLAPHNVVQQRRVEKNPRGGAHSRLLRLPPRCRPTPAARLRGHGDGFPVPTGISFGWNCNSRMKDGGWFGGDQE
jgi:hypothetical protein